MLSFIFESAWGFPILEVLHVLGITLWVGSIAVLDFRLIGWSKTTPMHPYHLVPWAYAGIAITVITGLLFVAGNPSYLANPAFQLKIILIAIAGVSSLALHNRVIAAAGNLRAGQRPPRVARFAGAMSLLLWFAVVVAARTIPYAYAY